MCFLPLIYHPCGHFSTPTAAPYVLHTRLCRQFATTGTCPGSAQDDLANPLTYPLACPSCANEIETTWHDRMLHKLQHYTTTIPRSPYLVNLITQAATDAYTALLEEYAAAVEETVVVPWREKMNGLMASATVEVPDEEEEDWMDLDTFDYGVWTRRFDQIWVEVEKLVRIVGIVEAGDVGGLLERFRARGLGAEAVLGFLVDALADCLEGRAVAR